MSLPARVAEHEIDPQFTDRWSPRAFTAEPIPDAVLMSCFEAARWAPSSYNIQPWRFVYGRRDTAAFAPILDALMPFNQAWAKEAAALVAVLAKKTWVPPGKSVAEPVGSASFDTGAAWSAFALQATLSGWSTHAMGGFDRDKLRSALGIPEDVSMECVVAIGKRGDAASLPEALRPREVPSPRRPLAESIAEGRYSFGA